MRGKGEGSVFKDDRGLWNAWIELPSHDGTRRRKVVRRKLKKDLLEELTRLRNELQSRGDLPTNSQTVAQWFTYWLTLARKDVSPNTFDGYKRTVANHIIPAIGTVKLDKVTAAHVRRVTDRMTDNGLSSTTALLAHRIMAVSFKIAVREGRIGRNPAELTSAPRKAAVTLEALDLEDALVLMKHLLQPDVEGARWATSLLTGARRGEVIGLEIDRVSDVLDLSWQLQRIPLSGKAGKPVVPADYEYRHIDGGLYWTRPKSSKGWRVIPLIDPLRAILERHIAESEPNPWGLLFLNNGRPISPDQDSRNWRTLLAETGMEKNVRLHDIRHTTVDLLYLAGIPEDLIMEIVGHSTRSVTRGYKSRVNRDRLTAAMTDFSALFTRPTEGTRPAIDG